MSRLIDEDTLRRVVREEFDRRAAAPPKLMDRAEVVAMLGVCDRTLSRLIMERAIPLPVMIGGRIERWRRDAILRWVDSGAPAFRGRSTAGSMTHGDRRS